MQPVAGDTRLTYDDFLLFPDDGRRHELIDGEHYVTPSPTLRHQALIGRLYFEIESFLRARTGLGRVFLSPLDVLFTKWDVVEPDLLFVSADQDDILTPKSVQGPPALVVEVLSASTRKTDEQIKSRRLICSSVLRVLADSRSSAGSSIEVACASTGSSIRSWIS